MKLINKYKLKVLSMFLVMGLMSFVPEKNPELFGDFTCEGSVLRETKNIKYIDGCRLSGNPHSPSTHWGFRHWIWFAAGLTFAIWTVAEVIDSAQKN